MQYILQNNRNKITIDFKLDKDAARKGGISDCRKTPVLYQAKQGFLTYMEKERKI